MRKAVLVVLIVAIAAVLFASLRPSTPARTFDAYQLKAKDTAESVLSSVGTAQLAAQVGTKGRAFPPYVSVLMSEAEVAVGRADASFGSLQPPDAHSDRVRNQLSRIVSDAQQVVGNLRITARRGDLASLQRRARPLTPIVHRLERFLARHG